MQQCVTELCRILLILKSHGVLANHRFLACLLFGKPRQTNIPAQAYRTLVAAHLSSPEAILRAGWDELVHLLDEAHYVRYDFSTATKPLEVSEELKRRTGA
jgi:hypothetical protein